MMIIIKRGIETHQDLKLLDTKHPLLIIKGCKSRPADQLC